MGGSGGNMTHNPLTVTLTIRHVVFHGLASRGTTCIQVTQDKHDVDTTTDGCYIYMNKNGMALPWQDNIRNDTGLERYPSMLRNRVMPQTQMAWITRAPGYGM